MYLIIEEDYTISKSKILSGHLRNRCRRGEISIVRIRDLHGMNLPENQEELGEWSEVSDYSWGC